MASRSEPGSPSRKGGGKLMTVRVLLLDDTLHAFSVPCKCLGRTLFEQVVRHLGLIESDYFDLDFTDSNNSLCWLDHEKPLNKQLAPNNTLCRFSVKFFAPDPGSLEDELTRYMFALQIKRELSSGNLVCNENTASLLASYIVQADRGDYIDEECSNGLYIQEMQLLPQQTPMLVAKIQNYHRQHTGMTPAEADFNLLDTARKVDMYGVRMHAARDYDNVSLNLAVAHTGVLVYQGHTKINTFSWAKIRKLSFKRKKYLVKLHPDGYGYYKDTVEFHFSSRDECKNFWKKCIEHHSFFRCQSTRTLPRQKHSLLSRGSSFRYSGRTQKELTELARVNAPKREPFTRSTSCRLVSKTPDSSLPSRRSADLHLNTSTLSSASHTLDRRRYDSFNSRGESPRKVPPARLVLDGGPPAYTDLQQRSLAPEHQQHQQPNHVHEVARVEPMLVHGQNAEEEYHLRRPQLPSASHAAPPPEIDNDGDYRLGPPVLPIPPPPPYCHPEHDYELEEAERERSLLPEEEEVEEAGGERTERGNEASRAVGGEREGGVVVCSDETGVELAREGLLGVGGLGEDGDNEHLCTANQNANVGGEPVICCRNENESKTETVAPNTPKRSSVVIGDGGEDVLYKKKVEKWDCSASVLTPDKTDPDDLLTDIPYVIRVRSLTRTGDEEKEAQSSKSTQCFSSGQRREEEEESKVPPKSNSLPGLKRCCEYIPVQKLPPRDSFSCLDDSLSQIVTLPFDRGRGTGERQLGRRAELKPSGEARLTEWAEGCPESEEDSQMTASTYCEGEYFVSTIDIEDFESSREVSPGRSDVLSSRDASSHCQSPEVEILPQISYRDLDATPPLEGVVETEGHVEGLAAWNRSRSVSPPGREDRGMDAVQRKEGRDEQATPVGQVFAEEEGEGGSDGFNDDDVKVFGGDIVIPRLIVESEEDFSFGEDEEDEELRPLCSQLDPEEDVEASRSFAGTPIGPSGITWSESGSSEGGVEDDEDMEALFVRAGKSSVDGVDGEGKQGNSLLMPIIVETTATPRGSVCSVEWYAAVEAIESVVSEEERCDDGERSDDEVAHPSDEKIIEETAAEDWEAEARLIVDEAFAKALSSGVDSKQEEGDKTDEIRAKSIVERAIMRALAEAKDDTTVQETSGLSVGDQDLQGLSWSSSNASAEFEKGGDSLGDILDGVADTAVVSSSRNSDSFAEFEKGGDSLGDILDGVEGTAVASSSRNSDGYAPSGLGSMSDDVFLEGEDKHPDLKMDNITEISEGEEASSRDVEPEESAEAEDVFEREEEGDTSALVMANPLAMEHASPATKSQGKGLLRRFSPAPLNDSLNTSDLEPSFDSTGMSSVSDWSDRSADADADDSLDTSGEVMHNKLLVDFRHAVAQYTADLESDFGASNDPVMACSTPKAPHPGFTLFNEDSESEEKEEEHEVELDSSPESSEILSSDAESVDALEVLEDIRDPSVVVNLSQDDILDFPDSSGSGKMDGSPSSLPENTSDVSAGRETDANGAISSECAEVVVHTAAELESPAWEEVLPADDDTPKPVICVEKDEDRKKTDTLMSGQSGSSAATTGTGSSADYTSDTNTAETAIYRGDESRISESSDVAEGAESRISESSDVAEGAESRISESSDVAEGAESRISESSDVAVGGAGAVDLSEVSQMMDGSSVLMASDMTDSSGRFDSSLVFQALDEMDRAVEDLRVSQTSEVTSTAESAKTSCVSNASNAPEPEDVSRNTACGDDNRASATSAAMCESQTSQTSNVPQLRISPESGSSITSQPEDYEDLHISSSEADGEDEKDGALVFGNPYAMMTSPARDKRDSQE